MYYSFILKDDISTWKLFFDHWMNLATRNFKIILAIISYSMLKNYKTSIFPRYSILDPYLSASMLNSWKIDSMNRTPFSSISKHVLFLHNSCKGSTISSDELRISSKILLRERCFPFFFIDCRHFQDFPLNTGNHHFY